MPKSKPSSQTTYTSKELLNNLQKHIDLSAERLRIRLKKEWAKQEKTKVRSNV